MEIKSIYPQIFLQAVDQKTLGNSVIIDVREPHEWDYYHMEEAKLIPMQQIPLRMGELPEDEDIYIVCAHGMRSLRVAEYLKENGFERVINVDGGMAAIGMFRGFQYD
ncbi:Thiosulfate sulfurtransferase GlpE [Paenibacillus allorhizoplanae]|uniref:Thiosulfate sulfurtransferase GlpE n=1 Tax=Paenibacillus allorhizoplanae TaxID=2905648 RepID=A0ABM9BY86_9BACL|nr:MULTISPECIES: rhodanese-like domain-containing protein [Paenibacillus]KRE69305.1 sulfurtransferase [Paenibacillus sp. Soil750]CAH1197298.1 Thiosulfate sulfurtransferase GlpE [Paenibacillus allorhizoplanae]